MHDVFLSYNNRDFESVNQIATQLKENGLSVFFDRWYLVPGMPWPQHLEKILNECKAVAVFLGPNSMGPWQQREQYLALELQTRKPVFPVIPVLLPNSDPALGFLSLNTWIDFREGLNNPSLLLVLKSAIFGQASAEEEKLHLFTTLSSICPYRGLRFFREEDAPFFFGRSAFNKKLVENIERHSLVTVVGESGSGKSSVVRAGLIPYLRQGKTVVWEAITMYPNENPFANLAAIFLPLLEPEMTEVDKLTETGKLAEAFVKGSVRLKAVVARVLEKQKGTERLLLMIDQWEELYTQVPNNQVKQKFIDEILDATLTGPLSVIITVRGDFFDEIVAYRPFSDRVQDAVVNISRLNDEELIEIIEGPAKKVHLKFEAGLSDRILRDVKGQPGYLPLLEFVLMELWSGREDEILTHTRYRAIGEVKGAIANHAEEIYSKLSKQEQDYTRKIFLQLVQPSITSNDNSIAKADATKRRIAFSDLNNEYSGVVKKLADAHLIVTGRSEAIGEETIDIVHEALIRGWNRLNNWIEDDIEFLIWREKLRTLMNISKEDSSILKGSLLKEAKRWFNERNADLSISEISFIKKSLKSLNKMFYFGAAIAFLVIVYLLSIKENENKSISEKFNDLIKSNLNVHAAWIPIVNNFRLGDYGIYTDAIFSKVGNIKEDFGVDFTTDSGSNYGLDFVSEGARVRKFAGNSEVDVIPTGAPDARIEIEFTKESSFLLKSPFVKVTTIDSVKEVANKLKASGKWDGRWIVVYQVYNAQDAVIVLTTDAGTKLSFSGDASALGQMKLGSLGVNFSANHPLGLEIQGRNGVIGLGLFRIKSKLLFGGWRVEVL